MTRLYVKGRIQGHQRGKHVSHPHTSLVQIDGVHSQSEADFYLGKRLAYVYRGQKPVRGTTLRVIWGRVTRAHGNSGVVRAKFTTNIPPAAFGRGVRIFLYPSNSKYSAGPCSLALPHVLGIAGADVYPSLLVQQYNIYLYPTRASDASTDPCWTRSLTSQSSWKGFVDLPMSAVRLDVLHRSSRTQTSPQIGNLTIWGVKLIRKNNLVGIYVTPAVRSRSTRMNCFDGARFEASVHYLSNLSNHMGVLVTRSMLIQLHSNS